MTGTYGICGSTSFGNSIGLSFGNSGKQVQVDFGIGGSVRFRYNTGSGWGEWMWIKQVQFIVLSVPRIEYFENPVDVNTLTETGVYAYFSGSTNAPDNGGGIIIVGCPLENFVIQIATNQNTTQPSLYFRYHWLNTWTPWKACQNIVLSGVIGFRRINVELSGGIICTGFRVYFPDLPSYCIDIVVNCYSGTDASNAKLYIRGTTTGNIGNKSWRTIQEQQSLLLFKFSPSKQRLLFPATQSYISVVKEAWYLNFRIGQIDTD